MTYFNRRVEADGHVFDSQAEYGRWQQLRLLESAGQIRDLVVHPSWEIAPAVYLDGRRRRALRYTADFSYMVDAEGLIVEDVKARNGYRSQAYRLRRHLLKAGHGIEVREVI